ncbi:unnamed protein product [Soboliphyme baturini]|uniref:T-complex protein 1 subunit delta n=1 Tax=Soboliphyme baturini TaxID=241478 RepID=A0A183ILK0_9BILA|nr:unnamed protein product [Soboliphyme baturini]
MGDVKDSMTDSEESMCDIVMVTDGKKEEAIINMVIEELHSRNADRMPLCEMYRLVLSRCTKKQRNLISTMREFLSLLRASRRFSEEGQELCDMVIKLNGLESSPLNMPVSDAVRTSLGPRGMDKMIQSGKGEVIITNDGATILKELQVVHPTAKMLVELSKAQDIEAGDGTTTVVIVAGELLDAAQKLLNKGIHPTAISDAFQSAAAKAEEILQNMATPIDLDDTDLLVKIAKTSLNSKVRFSMFI